MLIDNGDDRHNGAVNNSLTVKEKDRLLELYEARALGRVQRDREQFASLLHLGRLLAQRGHAG